MIGNSLRIELKKQKSPKKIQKRPQTLQKGP